MTLAALRGRLSNKLVALSRDCDDQFGLVDFLLKFSDEDGVHEP
jgi:hypothetical protein